MRDKQWKIIQALAVCCFFSVLWFFVQQGSESEKFSENRGRQAETPGSSSKEYTMFLEEEVLDEERVSVHIPGLKNQYKFIFMSDLHIIVENHEISKENLENVRERREQFRTEDGRYAADLWKELPELFHSWNADAVLLGGDMIDYASTSNIECLKEGIDKMDRPVLYVRADHDSEPYNCEGLDKKEMKKLHQAIDGYEKISLIEFQDLCVVGINDSTRQISKGQLEKFREIINLGKPILLLTHVPLAPKADISLLEESRKVWQDRALVWGEGCTYEPNETTSEFLDLIYAKDSLVKAVFCGHLHFTWEGKLTENSLQHVFSAMYPGRVGVITVDGKMQEQGS